MKKLLHLLRMFFVVLASLTIIGCGGGDDNDSPDNDTGDNNPDLVYAVGDSMTEGVGSATPYPALLSPLIGKTVVNSGVGGQRSGEGVGIARSALTRNPGYLLIWYGTNDVILGGAGQENVDAVISNLDAMVQAARAQSTIPILSTLGRGIEGHAGWDPGFVIMNEAIIAYANANGVRLVRPDAAVGTNPELFQSDGLHFTTAGNQLVAEAFASRF